MTISITSQGQGIPLVLFHGWGFDKTIWQQVVPHLSKFQVFLVDLPGFGCTPLQSWKVFKRLLLNQLPQRFLLMGWSMGGLYATKLALEEESRIIQLINIASLPHFIEDVQWPAVNETVFMAFYERLLHNSKSVLQEFIQLQCAQRNTESIGPFNHSVAGLKEGLENLQQWDFRKQLATLNVPVTYLFGRLDRIVPYAVLPVMQKNYPHFSYYTFAKAAHLPFLSHPDEFISVLEKIVL